MSDRNRPEIRTEREIIIISHDFFAARAVFLLPVIPAPCNVELPRNYTCARAATVATDWYHICGDLRVLHAVIEPIMSHGGLVFLWDTAVAKLLQA